MIPALRIDPYTYDVQPIAVPPNGCALKSALRKELDAGAIAVAARMSTGDRLVIDPYKPCGSPHFQFLGGGAPIAGAGVLIGPTVMRSLTPYSLSSEDVLERTIFMDSFDAADWYATWSREFDVERFRPAA